MSKPDRLSLVTAAIFALVLGVIAWLALDAVGAFRRENNRPQVSRAELPPACPAPSAGERLMISIEVREGKFNVVCNTLRPFVVMREAQR
jgi:hypothetical protein